MTILDCPRPVADRYHARVAELRATMSPRDARALARSENGLRKTTRADRAAFAADTRAAIAARAA